MVLKAAEFVSYVKFSLNQTKRLYRCSMRVDNLSECQNIGVQILFHYSFNFMLSRIKCFRNN